VVLHLLAESPGPAVVGLSSNNLASDIVQDDPLPKLVYLVIVFLALFGKEIICICK
jgi:hypothetical protein